jgi:hypothetical protein
MDDPAGEVNPRGLGGPVRHDHQRAPPTSRADRIPSALQHSPAAPRPRPARTPLKLTPGHPRSTSPSTGSAETNPRRAHERLSDRSRGRVARPLALAQPAGAGDVAELAGERVKLLLATADFRVVTGECGSPGRRTADGPAAGRCSIRYAADGVRPVLITKPSG